MHHVSLPFKTIRVSNILPQQRSVANCRPRICQKDLNTLLTRSELDRLKLYQPVAKTKLIKQVLAWAGTEGDLSGIFFVVQL